MNTRLLLWPVVALLGLSSLSAQAVPFLHGYSFNIDDAIDNLSSGDPAPAGVDISSFDDVSGLGRITATITGTGAHTFDAYFDHDLNKVNWWSESGSAMGIAAAGQSWELDEPGFIFGDIYTNFKNTALDNGVGTLKLEDVSMAMGWDFTLSVAETAQISLLLSETAPASGLYLGQSHIVQDPAGDYSDYVFYLSSTISIAGGAAVPEPSILLLFGVGLTAMVVTRRKVKV